MTSDDVESLLQKALKQSENAKVNYYIRNALQHIQFESDMKRLEDE